MARKRKVVPPVFVAAAVGAGVPRARPVTDLAPEVAKQQVALYEAALRRDNAEFIRIRDGN